MSGSNGRAEFAASLRGLANDYSEALGRTGPARTTSPGRAVTVTLDASGVVTAVDVAASWDAECRYVEDLPGLILTTARAAAADQLGRAMVALAERDRTAVPRFVAPAGEPGPATPDKGARARTVEELRSGDGLAGLLREAVDVLGAELSVRGQGASANGRVRAVTDFRGSLVELEIDPDWSERATGPQIGTACTEAVAAALADRPPSDPQRVVGDRTRLGRLLHDWKETPR